MSDIEQYQFGGREIRVLDLDGEPWWVARDVCAILGYDHTPSAMRRLDEDEYSQFTPNVRQGHTGPPPRPMTIVNEAGLYALILGSAKPEAKAFKRWVTHDVLPSIRRTGGYQVAPVSVEVIVRTALAEMAHNEHVVPAAARILSFKRWRKPEKGIRAFVQLTLDLGVAPGIETKRAKGVTDGSHA